MSGQLGTESYWVLRMVNSVLHNAGPSSTPSMYAPLLTVLAVCHEKLSDVQGEKTRHTRVPFDTAR